MLTNDLVLDLFGRVHEAVGAVLDGASEAQLTARLDPGANTIGWLVWHLARVEDDHVAALVGSEQVWTGDGWSDRFGLPFDPAAIGYGQTSEEVGQVRVPAELLRGYYDAVHERTVHHLGALNEADYARVVDERWDPPVTLAVRLVSVVADTLQHAGQAAYIRGVLERQGGA